MIQTCALRSSTAMPATWPTTSWTPFSSGSGFGQAGSTRKLGAWAVVVDGVCEQAAANAASAISRRFMVGAPPLPPLYCELLAGGPLRRAAIVGGAFAPLP